MLSWVDGGLVEVYQCIDSCSRFAYLGVRVETRMLRCEDGDGEDGRIVSRRPLSISISEARDEIDIEAF